MLRLALGLLGHRPAGVVVEMSRKKPPEREPAFSQKLYNQLLSPLQVVIEHVHSGIKRLRSLRRVRLWPHSARFSRTTATDRGPK